MTFAEYQGWMNETWTIQSVVAGTYDSGVAQADTLSFTSQMTVEIQKSGQTGTTRWGESCQVTEGGLSGVRSLDGRQFLFQYDSSTGQLTCSFPDTSQQRQIGAVFLGSLLGTLAGAVAGFVTGSPGQGVLAGLVAALTGSLVTTATSPSYAQRTDSGGTYVAEDGSTSRKPYPLQAVSA